MDDRGCLAESLKRTPSPRRSRASGASSFSRSLNRLQPLLQIRLPRGLGIAAAALVVGGAIAYGTVRGDHVQNAITQFRDARDAIANTAGFRIASIVLSGEKEVAREDILAAAGVTGRSSLLFLDAEAARARLKINPWIAEATVLKLYPDRLHISVVERTAFALWQKDGSICVIAADGTVVQPFVDQRFAHLPLVVGRGAEQRAQEFVSLVDRYPELRGQIRASILVAERRWNVKLRNGVDIRLPEADPESAFATLARLDRDKKLLSRDIAAIDLRLSDRVTVRLSDRAAQAREDAQKERKAKRKGGDA